MARPPGSSLPAAMQLAWLLARPVHYYETMGRRYGDIFTTRSPIFGSEVMVSRSDTVREVFRGDPEVFRAGEANQSLSTLLGKHSVLVLDGEPHRRQRKLLMPPFFGERMRSYTDIMREQTLRAIGPWRDGEPVALQPVMQQITLQVILRAVLGMEDEAPLEALRASLDLTLVGPTSVIGMLPLIPALQRDLGPLWPWAEFLRRLHHTDTLIYKQIQRARARDRNGRSDILTMLLDAVDEDGQGMTDQELRDELMTLLVAGHETTATSLCWAVELILNHSSVRARVMAELREVVDTEMVSAEHIGQLRYLDAAIKESMRLRPIIPAVGRIVKRDVQLQGYDVPAGEMVVPCGWLLHRDPSIYPEPERFYPDRFLDKKPDPYAWMPFGGGVRRCIGMAFALHEMKVVLATLLTQRHLAPLRPGLSPVVMRGLALAPRGGSVVVPSAVAPS